jgi:hypothetical protein
MAEIGKIDAKAEMVIGAGVEKVMEAHVGKEGELVVGGGESGTSKEKTRKEHCVN